MALQVTQSRLVIYEHTSETSSWLQITQHDTAEIQIKKAYRSSSSFGSFLLITASSLFENICKQKQVNNLAIYFH